jgi:hypothetical protein
MDERDKRIRIVMDIIKRMGIEEIEVIERILKDAKMVKEGLRVK